MTWKLALVGMVSYIEMYVAFRVGRDGSPLSVGSGGVNPFQPVTFAADFTFCKQLLTAIFHQCDVVAGPFIDLSPVQIYPPQPAVLIGWPVDLETVVIEHLRRFVGNRPIKSQALARPSVVTQ